MLDRARARLPRCAEGGVPTTAPDTPDQPNHRGTPCTPTVQVAKPAKAPPDQEQPSPPAPTSTAGDRSSRRRTGGTPGAARARNPPNTGQATRPAATPPRNSGTPGNAWHVVDVIEEQPGALSLPRFSGHFRTRFYVETEEGHHGNEEVSAGAAGTCGAVVSGVGSEAGDPAAGRVVEPAPGGAAELDPPGRGRSRGARRSAVDGDDRGEPAPGPGGRGAAAGERGAAGGERVFRCGDRPDPEKIMSFIDAHGFSVGLVLRVLGIASSTYYEWRARVTLPARRRREDAELLALIDEIRASHEFAGTYGSEAGVAGAAPPRGAGSAANVSSGSCARTTAAAPTCARGGRVARRSRIRGTPPHGSAGPGLPPRPPRTASGWPI